MPYKGLHKVCEFSTQNIRLFLGYFSSPQSTVDAFAILSSRGFKLNMSAAGCRVDHSTDWNDYMVNLDAREERLIDIVAKERCLYYGREVGAEYISL
ncbi:hypothetical protein DPM35_03135 [Mesorhizobium atlanticum]|uniref:Uncharacterized protein n=1 Tax=Mesorhizobium atlanticum TaxID=2233532 RepID=A0A330GYG4_9HYPH|nr:hypothetical protein DPM35_03135 [Mesorhizobium atlanticum]